MVGTSLTTTVRLLTDAICERMADSACLSAAVRAVSWPSSTTVVGDVARLLPRAVGFHPGLGAMERRLGDRDVADSRLHVGVLVGVHRLLLGQRPLRLLQLAARPVAGRDGRRSVDRPGPGRDVHAGGGQRLLDLRGLKLQLCDLGRRRPRPIRLGPPAD